MEALHAAISLVELACPSAHSLKPETRDYSVFLDTFAHFVVNFMEIPTTLPSPPDSCVPDQKVARSFVFDFKLKILFLYLPSFAQKIAAVT